MSLEHLIGTKIGMMTVIGVGEVDKNRHRLLILQCECGKVVHKTLTKAKRIVKGCGTDCELMHPCIIGLKINRWTILRELTSNGCSYLECLCDCGNIMIVSRGNVLRGGSKSCGCLRVEVSSSRLGPKNPAYKDGKSYIGHRKCTEYYQWIRKVKKRDLYTCQICGFHQKNNRGVVSHHLNSYAAFPDQKHLVDNGVCLCFNCHDTFHKQYKFPVTFEKFIEHLRSLKIPIISEKLRGWLAN